MERPEEKAEWKAAKTMVAKNRRLVDPGNPQATGGESCGGGRRFLSSWWLTVEALMDLTLKHSGACF
jgi:hypothetical protein